MKIRESEEMYLETILLLTRRMPSVHSINIAEELNYSRPSVSRAVNLLQNKGYITVGDTGVIKFTEEGRKKAESVYERHEALTKLFIILGAQEQVAEENACRVEHVITDEMFEKIKKFTEKVSD